MILIVVAQNTERVEFEFLWWAGSLPHVVLLATALVTVAADQLVGLAPAVLDGPVGAALRW